MNCKNLFPTKSLRTLVPGLLLATSLGTARVHAQPSSMRYSQVRITMTSKSDIVALAQAGVTTDNIDFQGNYADVILSNTEISILKNAGWPYQILVDDVEAAYRQRPKLSAGELKSLERQMGAIYATPGNFHLGSMGGFLTFDEVVTDLDAMRYRYPSLITEKKSIGTSVEGRKIWMVKISRNPEVDEQETEVLYTALTHAREPQSMTTVIYFMWYMLENYGVDPTVTDLLNTRELYFVPVVNPDGYEYNRLSNPSGGGMWRKNRRNNGSSYGVDLNRNYGYGWGYDNTGSSPSPSNDTYRGASAFSEPETQAIRDLALSRQFKAVVNYHGYGNWWVFPWGYLANRYTPDHSLFVAWSQDMTRYNGYVYGTPNQTVGYVVNGGADDWFYGEQTLKPKAYCFTPEIGTSSDGFWPTHARIIPIADENIAPNLLFAAAGGLDATPPAISGERSSNVTGSSAIIAWTTNEASNSIVEYGTTTSYGSTSYATTLLAGHSLTLNGLSSNTLYHYRVKSTDVAGNDAVSGDHTFQTGATFNYAPTSTTILQGSLKSGTYANLATDNANYYAVNSTTSGTRKSDWYGTATVSQSPSRIIRLTALYDGKYSAGLTQTLHLYNWASSSWTQVDSRSAGTSDVTVTSVQNSPANFISPSGEIRLRILGTGGSKSFTGSGDYVRFTVETAGS